MMVAIRTRLVCFLAFGVFTASVASAQSEISFSEAWRLTEQHNASLEAAHWQVQASSGALKQSQLLPNPSLAISVENVAGTGSYRNGDVAEVTYQLSEPIQLGQKRLARQQAANANYQLQIKNLDATRASLYTKFGQRFVDVLVAEQWLAVCKNLEKNNRTVAALILRRLRAGNASEFDLHRADIVLGDSRLQVLQAQNQLVIAKNSLATLWGVEGKIDFHLTEAGLPHQLADIKDLKLAQSPLLAPYESAITHAHAKVKITESEAWPDLNAGLGLRRFNQTRDTALVAALSVPLPLFDRNQGNRLQANAEYAKSRADAEQAAIDLQQQAMSLYQTAEQASREAHIARTSLLPKARLALKLATNGFQQGRYSYIELSAAQQQLLTEEQHYWQAHASYDKAVIALQGLIGNFQHNI